jgi:hypothetical protein
MRTTLEDQADTIVMLSKEIETAETELQYCAGLIAGMAADDETDTPVFRSQVLRYRELRESLKSVKAAYQDALDG